MAVTIIGLWESSVQSEKALFEVMIVVSEALAALKEKHPELQIILLTGHGSVEKGVEAMKLGAMDFLEKPIDMNALTEKIKQAKAQKMILVDKKTEQKLKEIMNTKGW